VGHTAHTQKPLFAQSRDKAISVDAPSLLLKEEAQPIQGQVVGGFVFDFAPGVLNDAEDFPQTLWSGDFVDTL
jgi:hypothetical protein